MKRPLTWPEFSDFIERDNDFGESFLEELENSYTPELHACGTKGMEQFRDRINFIIDMLHAQICSHPSIGNPDSDFDHIRGQIATVAQDLFQLAFMIWEMQQSRPKDLN
jgi:hypothetical protein|tara:strand:- start:731 stop:1057 length:327 start_codon:yes stop_codon:yes gene_type:complete